MKTPLLKSQYEVDRGDLGSRTRAIGGTDQSRGYCLKLAFADFLAGGTEESTHKDKLLIHRLVTLLRPEYQAHLTRQKKRKEVETAARS